MEEKIQNVYNFLIQPENKHLKEFVKTFNEPDGFVFSTSEECTEISDALDSDGHSGSSLAMCMRHCQKLFNLEEQNKTNL
jgi:hypothetical protein